MTDPLRSLLYGNYRSASPGGSTEEDGTAARAVLLRWLVECFFPADRAGGILDIGCGAGDLIAIARTLGYTDLRGVDRSSRQIAQARARGIAGIEEGDLLATLAAVPEGSLDALVAVDVLEHLRKDELVPLTASALKALKPGGRWIIHVPNGESPFFGAVQFGDLTHETIFTRHSLAQILTASGFSKVDCREVPPMSRSWKGPVRRILWRLLRGLLRLVIAIETGNGGRDAVLSRTLVAVAFR